MRCSKSYMRSLFHWSFACRDHAVPKAIQAIEQEQPGRARQRLRLGDPDLGTMVIAKHLCGPLRCFRTGNLAESLDCGSGDPQGHCPKARDHTGKRRDAIAWLGK